MSNINFKKWLVRLFGPMIKAGAVLIFLVAAFAIIWEVDMTTSIMVTNLVTLFLALTMLFYMMQNIEDRDKERAENLTRWEAEAKRWDVYMEELRLEREENKKRWEFVFKKLEGADLVIKSVKPDKPVKPDKSITTKTDTEIDELVNATLNTTAKFKDISARIQKNIETIEDIANAGKKLSRNARDITRTANKFKQ